MGWSPLGREGQWDGQLGTLGESHHLIKREEVGQPWLQPSMGHMILREDQDPKWGSQVPVVIVQPQGRQVSKAQEANVVWGAHCSLTPHKARPWALPGGRPVTARSARWTRFNF
jgi:hypothetical protein